ncbi:FAD/NAD(P)-binding domain-containing protein [Xylariaceae sp. AK1471]|nr:FAD/NAD(P)-binding domain-containing protein [Xylariaceae sp. AK1471]
MPLKVLIIGAGVCGPAFATLLQRADPSHEITIIERADKLRETGLQIDLRAQGIPVVRKMGLIEAIRKRAVPENGVAFVDAKGRPFATFGKNDSGQGAQGMTSEYEIMRGDLVNVFYRASLGLNQDDDDDNTDDDDGSKNKVVISANGNVRYEFGTTVTHLSQNDDAAVDVTFSNGRKARYDLVVGADGQASRTRRMLLDNSKEANDACFKSLGLYTALYLVPRTAEDDGWMKVHLMPGRRGIFTRSGDPKAPTQVYMAVQTSRDTNAYGVCTAMKQSVAEQRETFTRAFADQRGWRVPGLMEALQNKTRDEDFYATEIGQVRCSSDKLAVGRVVLLGDAGYCPSPITGMGTTLSLTGAYILAGELARHCRGGSSSSNSSSQKVPEALRSYARVVKPFVDEAQKLVPGVPGILYAESSWGVWILTTIISLVSKSGIADIMVRLLPENKGGLAIPEYPELNLAT